MANDENRVKQKVNKIDMILCDVHLLLYSTLLYWYTELISEHILSEAIANCLKIIMAFCWTVARIHNNNLCAHASAIEHGEPGRIIVKMPIL